jgi:hypothetical protein
MAVSCIAMCHHGWLLADLPFGYLFAEGVIAALPPCPAPNCDLHGQRESLLDPGERFVERVAVGVTDDVHVYVLGGAAALAEIAGGPRSEDVCRVYAGDARECFGKNLLGTE